MSQGRDTHFAGWAKLQIQKLQEEGLLEMWNPDFGGIDQEKVRRATQLLTQGAYDLVYFLLDKTEYHSGSFDVGWGTPDEIHETISRLPDMTEWPVEPDQTT